MNKLLSRKLIIAILTIVTAVVAKEYVAAVATAIAYIVAQGYVDAKTAKNVEAIVDSVLPKAKK